MLSIILSDVLNGVDITEAYPAFYQLLQVISNYEFIFRSPGNPGKKYRRRVSTAAGIAKSGFRLFTNRLPRPNGGTISRGGVAHHLDPGRGAVKPSSACPANIHRFGLSLRDRLLCRKYPSRCFKVKSNSIIARSQPCSKPSSLSTNPNSCASLCWLPSGVIWTRKIARNITGIIAVGGLQCIPFRWRTMGGPYFPRFRCQRCWTKPRAGPGKPALTLEANAAET